VHSVADLITVQIQNLVQGISQQADASRDPTQGDAQINGVSSLGEGLRKRDPSIAIALVSENAFGKALIHAILRDSGEKYVAVISAAAIRVFDLQGNSIPVAGPGLSYLAGVTDPGASLRARTIADFTFISNRQVVPAMAPDLAPETPRPSPHEALVWVKAANYGQAYSVSVNGITAKVNTAVSAVVVSGGVTLAYPISTAEIAARLRAALLHGATTGLTVAATATTLNGQKLALATTTDGDGTGLTVAVSGNGATVTATSITAGGTGYEVGAKVFVAKYLLEGGADTSPVQVATISAASAGPLAGVGIARHGSVLHLTSGNPITLAASDARANADITAITNSVQAFTSLPTIAPAGYQVEIVGDPGNRYDGYYVKFAPRDGAGDFGEGSWIETVAPGVEYKVDPATMPHVLIRMADGTFWFGPADGSVVNGLSIPKWGGRTAGDYDTAKDPSFIGQPINDVFTFENRLLFAADENIFQSRAQEYFELFPETTTAVLDSDPIDVTASGIDKVSVLKFVVPFQGELIAFSDSAQFRYSSNGTALTPGTARVSVLTQYEIDPGVRPLQVGGSIVMAQKNGQWTQFREFGVRGAGTALTADAPSISETVASYIPGDIFVMAENTTGNAWYAVSARQGYENRIYTHKYFYNGDERKQSSWSYWELPGVGKILYILCVEEVLYILCEYPEGQVWLERMRVSDRAVDDDSEYPLMLDRRVSTTEATPEAIRVSPGTYDAQTNTTTWSLPYRASHDLQAWSAYGGTWEGGVRIASAAAGAEEITAMGDWSDAHVYFGQVYTFFYRFSRFRARVDLPSGGKVSLNERRTQVRRLLLRYEASGFFEVRVKAEGRDSSKVYPFTSFGPQESGVFAVPILSDGAKCDVELWNSTARPCRFIGAEWTGLVTGRGRLLR
jgi:hypothetical protein